MPESLSLLLNADSPHPVDPIPDVVITLHHLIAAALRSVWPEEQARGEL